jgi:putative Mg2+ transporter-C (MgtC) family protein
MPLTIGWFQIALRLFLAAAAAALIGWDRGEHGKAAGLRTTLLVCLAAALAMIETNLLLDTRGKAPDSFVVLDLMRLPLGILSGMGFIGAGAIIRRGDSATGVTTAATLWFVTVTGLCFGAGSIGLGVVATALGYGALTAMKRLERLLPAERRASVEVTVEGDVSVRDALSDGRRYHVVERGAVRLEAGRRRFSYELRWRGAEADAEPTELFARLAALPGIIEYRWRSAGP